MGVTALDRDADTDPDIEDIAALTPADGDLLRYDTDGSRYTGIQPGALSIIPTGGTVSDQLADLLAREFWLEDYGGVGDDDESKATANTTALNLVMAEIEDAGGGVLKSLGSFYFEPETSDPAARFPQAPIIIRGAGSRKTIWKLRSGASLIGALLANPYSGGEEQTADDVTIMDMTFEGNGNASEQATAKAAGLLRLYQFNRLRLIRSRFWKGRGYGVGLQGVMSSGGADTRGPQNDLYMESCELISNGKAAYFTGAVTDYDDGIDAKSLNRGTFIDCYAYDNGDKGFDIRGQQVSYIGTRAKANVTAGFACSRGGGEPTQSSHSFDACWAEDNAIGLSPNAEYANTDLVPAQLSVSWNGGALIGSTSHNISVPTAGGTNLIGQLRLRVANADIRGATSRGISFSSQFESLLLQNNNIRDNGTQGVAVDTSQTAKACIIMGNDIRGNGSHGVSLGSSDLSAGAIIMGNSITGNGGWGLIGASNVDNVIEKNNYFSGNTSGPVSLTGTGNRRDLFPQEVLSSTAAVTTIRRADVGASATAFLTSGTLFLVAVFLPRGMTVTNIRVLFAADAITPTNLWYGLYDKNLAKLQVTADNTNGALTAGALKTLALASPFVTTYDGLHYVAIMSAAGTTPTGRIAAISSNAANILPRLCGNTSDTGLTNPASAPSTAGSITAGASIPYVELA